MLINSEVFITHRHQDNQPLDQPMRSAETAMRLKSQTE